MTATAAALTNLKSQRPEWAPWLAVVEETLRAAGGRLWDTAVPTPAALRSAASPALASAVVTLDARMVDILLRRLIDVASQSGTPQMATLPSLLDTELDPLELFKASICHDAAATAATALACDVDAGALEAVVALLSVPFLQACGRQWAVGLPPGWREGYCRVCGTWPAFAEVRGIERTRVFRCGRCGDAWHALPLRCPYCNVDDHNALVSLVPENGGGSNAVIEGCQSCLGYVKAFTKLQGGEPATVMLDDLASVHLDVAALEQGYLRQPGPGYRLDVTVVNRPS